MIACDLIRGWNHPPYRRIHTSISLWSFPLITFLSVIAFEYGVQLIWSTRALQQHSAGGRWMGGKSSGSKEAVPHQGFCHRWYHTKDYTLYFSTLLLNRLFNAILIPQQTYIIYELIQHYLIVLNMWTWISYYKNRNPYL